MVDGRNGKPRKVSRRVAEAVRLILSGEVTTIKASAVRVGLHPNYLSGYLAGPVGREYLARERAKTLTEGSVRAARRVVELIDASSEHVSLDASRLALAIEGVKPADDTRVSVSVDVRAGYVIDIGSGVSDQVHFVGPAADALPQNEPGSGRLMPPPVEVWQPPDRLDEPEVSPEVRGFDEALAKHQARYKR
jgi:hypothetical protein